MISQLNKQMLITLCIFTFVSRLGTQGSDFNANEALHFAVKQYSELAKSVKPTEYPHQGKFHLLN